VVGTYRLAEFGFRLASGAHLLRRADVETLETAVALVAAAEQRAAAIEASAADAFEAERRRGYEDGLAAARLEATERLLAESLTLDQRLDEVEGELADLVMQGVRKLVAEFDERAKAESMMRAALAQMRREKKAELRVSRAQLGELRAVAERVRAEFPELQLVDVLGDDTLQSPNVVVETAIGRVEGDLGRAVGDLERALRGVGALRAQAREEAR
jgi:type III secretion protein L